MSKPAKKPAAAQSPKSVSAAKPLKTLSNPRTKKRAGAASALPGPIAKSRPETAGNRKTKKGNSGSKQSHVLAMLQSSTGATIAAMMQATGWQQHSVRGFLAGVVRKRLKLTLTSNKVDGKRVYQIASGERGKSTARQSKRQS
jgi:hypothetical protein